MTRAKDGALEIDTDLDIHRRLFQPLGLMAHAMMNRG